MSHPSNDISFLRGKTIAVVGNGPGVLNSGLGAIIDGHDEVARFNKYKTLGFEADVGTRTTLWCTFGRGMTPAPGEPKPQRALMTHEKANPGLKLNEVLRIPFEFYSSLFKEVWEASSLQNTEAIKPTSGFLVIRWLLENGMDRISLAGFDHFSKTKSKLHHYWIPQAFGKPKQHDGDAERRLLQPWVLEGRLTYLPRSVDIA